jgi:hypothetical protein
MSSILEALTLIDDLITLAVLLVAGYALFAYLSDRWHANHPKPPVAP